MLYKIHFYVVNKSKQANRIGAIIVGKSFKMFLQDRNDRVIIEFLWIKQVKVNRKTMPIMQGKSSAAN